MNIKNSKNNSNKNNNNNNNKNHSNNLYLKIINNKLLKNDINKYVLLNCDWRAKKIIKNEQFNRLQCDSTYKYLIVQDFDNIEEFNKFIKSLESTIISNSNNGKIDSGSNSMVSLKFSNSKILVRLSKFNVAPTIRNLEFDDLMLELEEGAPLFKKLFGEREKSLQAKLTASIFSNLTSLDLGKYNEHVMQGGYLVNAVNLKKVTFSHMFTSAITQNLLPDQIESLVFKCGYSFDRIHFPASLKELSFVGRSNYVVSFNYKILNFIPNSLSSILLEYCDTMDVIATRKIINSIKKISIIHNKIYLSVLNRLLNSLYQNNDHYFQDLRIPDITNTSSTPAYSIPPPPRITQQERLKIPRPMLESLSIEFSGGPLQQTNSDLFPSSLTELTLPLNLLVCVFDVKRGFPGSIKSFEGTLSHLSTRFENPQNITSLSTIVTTEYTSHNPNIQSHNSFNIEYLSKNNIDYNSTNISNNNRLINQFRNLKSLKLSIIDPNLISAIPISINSLEISRFKMLFFNPNQVQDFSHHVFNFDLVELINLKSLRLDDLYTNLLFEKLSSRSNSTLIAESPFPSNLLLLDLTFNSELSTSGVFTLNQSFFNPIKFLIIRGDSKPTISSLPPFIELVFIQDSNPILKDSRFLSHYSSIIRTFNTIDENIIFKNLATKLNIIY